MLAFADSFSEQGDCFEMKGGNGEYAGQSVSAFAAQYLFV